MAHMHLNVSESNLQCSSFALLETGGTSSVLQNYVYVMCKYSKWDLKAECLSEGKSRLN